MIVNVNEFVFGLYFVEQSASTMLDSRILEQKELVAIVHFVAYARRSRSISEGPGLRTCSLSRKWSPSPGSSLCPPPSSFSLRTFVKDGDYIKLDTKFVKVKQVDWLSLGLNLLSQVMKQNFEVGMLFWLSKERFSCVEQLVVVTVPVLGRSSSQGSFCVGVES